MDFLDRIVEDLKMQFPIVYDDIVNYRLISNYSILLTTSNGKKYIYQYLDHSLKRIGTYDGSEESWRSEFSYSLRQQMMEKGFGQKRLSEESGISQQMISRYLNRKSVPTAYAVERLARTLNCKKSDLIDFNRYFDD